MVHRSFRTFLGCAALSAASFLVAGCPQAGNANEVTGDNATAQGTADGTAANSTSNQADNNAPDLTTTTSNGQEVVDTGDQNAAGDNPATPMVGDFDGDAVVSESDIQILSRSFGSSLTGGDLNSDGRIDILDLAILLTYIQ